MTLDILQILSAGPLKRTPLMYQANFSWKQMERSLDKLLASGFIYMNHSKHVCITKLCLEKLDVIRSVLGIHDDGQGRHWDFRLDKKL